MWSQLKKIWLKTASAYTSTEEAHAWPVLCPANRVHFYRIISTRTFPTLPSLEAKKLVASRKIYPVLGETLTRGIAKAHKNKIKWRDRCTESRAKKDRPHAFRSMQGTMPCDEPGHRSDARCRHVLCYRYSLEVSVSPQVCPPDKMIVGKYSLSSFPVIRRNHLWFKNHKKHI